MDNTPQLAQTRAPLNGKIILQQAGILALALIAYSALTYLLEFNIMSVGAGAVNFLVTVAISTGIALMTIRHHRDTEGGYIRLGRAFLIGFATAAVGIFLSGFWSYVLVNFIDPDYIARMKEQFAETWGQSMPAEQLEKAVADFDKLNQLGYTLQAGTIAALLFGALAALMAALIGRRNPPQ